MADKQAEALAAMLANIAEMPEHDRMIAERIHALAMSIDPALAPRLWYGMPAWAKNGKVICFFQSAAKFKVRYATFGFQPDANIDSGDMWATSWAVLEFGDAEEELVGTLLRKALGV